MEWINWSSDEGTYRWSLDYRSAVVFLADPNADKLQGVLHLELNAYGDQNVSIRLNGSPIYRGLLQGKPTRVDLVFDKTVLLDGKNVLEFETPEAKTPGPEDLRILGVALRSFSVSY